MGCSRELCSECGLRYRIEIFEVERRDWIETGKTTVATVHHYLFEGPCSCWRYHTSSICAYCPKVLKDLGDRTDSLTFSGCR